MFNFVTGYVEPHALERIHIAPIDLRKEIYRRIDAEIADAQAGRPAGIWMKCNQITDEGIIDRLYAASNAGVSDRIAGARDLLPEAGDRGPFRKISGSSRSIGRFLEHSRIYAFANGAAMPSPQAAVYISSADLMSRNLDRRVEALIPILNRTIHDQVLQQVLLANMLDTEQSWWLNPDGSYSRVESAMEGGGKPFNCHRYFMTNPSLSGRGGALEAGAVPSCPCAGALLHDLSQAAGRPRRSLCRQHARTRDHRYRLQHGAAGGLWRAMRAPMVLLNEKVTAKLGREIAATGRLADEAMALALRGLKRFALLLDDLGIEDVETVATAAVRDASNGPEFAAQLRAIGLEFENIFGRGRSAAERPRRDRRLSRCARDRGRSGRWKP